MSAKATVMKFGGTSLEDGRAFRRVAQIVRAHEDALPVVVVSAMSRVTNALLSSLRAAARGELSAAASSVEEHLERHLQVSRGLSAGARDDITSLIQRARREIAELLGEVAAAGAASARQQDLLASYGERLSASLLAAVLGEHGLPAAHVDARRCIVTDGEHGQARPFFAETYRRTRAELEPLLKARRVPVMGGFIGSTLDGVTTTLGRGSSDYTATLVSAALGARETQIWTDVNGVLTADPHLIETARTVPQLSYEEAEELASFGVRVLHPKMIQPAAEQQIPVRIFNSRVPEQVGTLICARTEAAAGTVKVIAHKTGMTTVEVTAPPAFVANGFLRALRRIFDRHGAALDIVASSEVGVSVACEEAGALPFIVQDLREVGSIEVKRDRAIICCVGEGVQGAPPGANELFDTLADISFTRHSTSGNNYVLVVDDECVGTVIRRLHYALFEHDARGRVGANNGNGSEGAAT